MQEVLALFTDEKPPEDREYYTLAMELMHAAHTGQFPFPGPLNEQPGKTMSAFRTIQRMLLKSKIL